MSKKLWGGRFSKPTNPLVEEFTKSIQYDYKLAEFDVLGSIIHVNILRKSGYLTAAEALKLTKALNLIYKGIKQGIFKADNHTEDIHTFIQNQLQKKAGDLVLKLHTARSRNDQVVFAVKMYCKSKIKDLLKELEKVLHDFDSFARKNKDVILPGFTHLQHAQPVYLKDYIKAYEEMLARDKKRLEFVLNNISLTMGAGALAGTPIPSEKYKVVIDGQRIQPCVNSLDTVSDRDFVIEIASNLSILSMHLSRFAEDLIIWSTKEFGFVDIDDAFCTGSSLMPQKKNADVLELIRGYTGRLYGNLMSLLTMMKALPLSYNRDMQLDKEPLFNSLEIIGLELRVLSGLVKSLKLNKDKIKMHLEDESLYATDLVYYLVKKGIAFKEAHTIVGKLIKYSIYNKIAIKDMPQGQLKGFCNSFEKKQIVKLFDARVSVQSKISIKR